MHHRPFSNRFPKAKLLPKPTFSVFTGFFTRVLFAVYRFRVFFCAGIPGPSAETFFPGVRAPAGTAIREANRASLGPLLLLGYLLLLVRRTAEIPGLPPEVYPTGFFAEDVYGPWKVLLYLNGGFMLLTLGRHWQGPPAPRESPHYFSAVQAGGGGLGFRKLGFWLGGVAFGGSLLQAFWAVAALLVNVQNNLELPFLAGVPALPRPSAALAHGLPALALLLTLGRALLPPPRPPPRGPRGVRLFRWCCWGGSYGWKILNQLPRLLLLPLLLLPLFGNHPAVQPLLVSLSAVLEPALLRLTPPLGQLALLFGRLDQSLMALLEGVPLGIPENLRIPENPPGKPPLSGVFAPWQAYGYGLGAHRLGCFFWACYRRRRKFQSFFGFSGIPGMLGRLLLGGAAATLAALTLGAVLSTGDRLGLLSWPAGVAFATRLQPSPAQSTALLGLAALACGGGHLGKFWSGFGNFSCGSGELFYRLGAGIWGLQLGLLGLLLLLGGLGQMPELAQGLAPLLAPLEPVFHWLDWVTGPPLQFFSDAERLLQPPSEPDPGTFF